VKQSSFKILVAEDDAIVRDVVVKFLTEEGYAVVVAHDGLDAIRLLSLEDIKMVLTDLRMPNADGMEVLRSAVQINPRMPVVLLTAYGTLDTALEAMKEGAYDYIVKPFVMQQLLLVVRNAYKMINLIEENERLSAHLREMYRNLDEEKSGKDQISELAVSGSRKRIDKLQDLGIITAEEAYILKEKLQSDGEPEEVNNGHKRIKEYGTLINGLKTDTDRAE